MSKLKIAVNTRLLIQDKLEGIGWFSFESLKRMVRAHPECEFIFIFDRPFSQDFIFSDNVRGVVLSPQARHPILFRIWFGKRMAKLLRKLEADVFLSPDGYLCLASEVPQLAVIHDLNFEHHTKDLPFLTGKYYRTFFPKFALKATRIATVSEFSKQDIVKCYGVSPAKIDVVFNGVNEVFNPLSEREVAEVRAEFTDNKPYFVFVGSLHPRKNIHRLFMAFDRFKSNTQSDAKLVIVGEKFWWNKEIKSAYTAMTFSSEVVFTGRLNGPTLAQVVAAAQAMVYVPYFEGFGIPILEAFKSEIPLITSNITSMPEVAGDAALLVNPFSVEAITEALVRLNGDEELCEELVEKGRQRLKDFSWNKTAESLWRSIEKMRDQQ